MYLKRLDIQGFKSFADKISLDFNSGITSVVGPNGSGKSNIADAVRWVLGEQSAKTLRGSKMEDIIFTGTESRKPLGLAEVSITIDNSDNTLPIAFNEVTITRRVFRSGESEYLINKTSCRLKDIHELFLDTGIGKDGYSIIGQGRVDDILSSKSEDRRLIFEEASGIMKYKERKQESERKLEQTRQNLLRINDIVSELENQLEPLKQQAETARHFLNIREGLKELEVNVFIENISRFKEKIKEYEEQYTSIKENIEEQNNILEKITITNTQKTELMKKMEAQLDTSRQQYYELGGSLERYSSEIKLNDEKISGFRQNITRLEAEMSEIGQKLSELDTDEEARQKKIRYLEAQFTDYSRKLASHEAKLETVLSSLDESERYIDGLKNSIMDKLDVLSDKKMQINNVKTQIEGINKRKAFIKNEVNELGLEKDRENMKKEDLSESIRKAKERINAAKEKHSGLQGKKAVLEKELDEKRKKQSSIKSDIQYKTSRFKLLSDMERNLEGYNRSVKQVLQACTQSKEFGRGIHGALAQLIKVDSRYETAIEMALGGALQNIVTSSEEDAKRAIEFLKNNRLGRATFLPVSAVSGRSLDRSIYEEVRKLDGFCGIASELVSFDQQYNGIMLSLLGRVIIAENLDAGIRIARKFNYSFRIVTLEGEVLSTSGSMTGGSTDSRGPGILSRSRELGELEVSLRKLKAEDDALEKDILIFIDKINGISQEMGMYDSEVRDNELVVIRDDSHLTQLNEGLKKLDARADMLKQEAAQLSRQEKGITEELGKYQQEQSDIEKDISETRRVVDEHQDKHKEEQNARDILHRDITDFKISVNSISESMQSVKEAINRINDEKEQSMKSVAKRQTEKERSLKEIAALNDSNEGLRCQIKAFNEEKTGKTLEMDRLTEDKKAMEEEIQNTVNQINETNKNIHLLQEEFGRAEVKKAKVESDMEALQNRLWDEYELTYNNALEFKKDIGGIAAAQKRINELRSEIKELGPVNVAAIDDYVKTRERYEFMSTQKNDMEQAEEKLRKVIYEMTAIMKQQFMEQFRLINANFSQVFRELFDGGRADLILVDSENVLESGIEIEVQPPGKKLQNMMLLSGGERAFTAIALLFAILRLKPTPFCILDEIEAALDDANVYRFADFIKKYAENTQFIMITHRKGTMEAADTLYGVTMQEHGVSKVISMKMGEMAS